METATSTTGLDARIGRILDDKIEELGDKKKKKKEFQLPKNIKSKKKKIKENYVVYFYIRSNRQFEISFELIENDTVYVKKLDKRYNASTDCIGYYNEFPCIIQPEWKLDPIRPTDIEGDAGDTKSAVAQKIIINSIEEISNYLKPSGSLLGGNKTIWYILGGCILAYIIYSAITGGA